MSLISNVRGILKLLIITKLYSSVVLFTAWKTVNLDNWVFSKFEIFRKVTDRVGEQKTTPWKEVVVNYFIGLFS